jgi:energy-coupling factor transporter ATP-binding protein EcfA2
MLENVKKVKFGRLAAEREIEEGLREYFLETGTFVRLRDGEKSILLGNRGSGKSAIIKMLSDYYKQKGNIVIELLPEDYSYEMLKRTSITNNEEKWIKASSYTAAWKYLMYVIAMKAYIQDSKTVVKSNAEPIYDYIRKNHKGYHKQNNWEILIDYIKRIEGIKIGNYEAGIKTRQLQELYKLEEITNLLPSLKKLTKRKPIIFLIDELDKGWDSSEEAQAFIGGLFQASVTLNQLSDQFKVIISLRKELYDNIPLLYEDYQKYNDMFEIIEWNRENLFELITKRIGFSLPSTIKKSNIEKWNTVFADEVNGKKSFDYIIDRTLNRPRELIQFCIDSKERAVEIRADKIDINAIVTSEVKYSDKRTKDIAMEYKFQYPSILNIFEMFRGNHSIISRKNMEELISSKVKNGNIINECNSWIKNQTDEFLITVLWQIGFFKIYTTCYINGELKKGYYGINEISQSNIGNIESFMIHPMFRMYLGIIDSKVSP